MKKQRLQKLLFLQPRSLVLIFLALTIVMFSSALIELNHSRQEQVELMEEHARTLLETVISSATNALLTYDHLELFLEDRLINNAMFLRYLLEQNKINNEFLKKFSADYQIYNIQIFRSDGKLLYSNRPYLHDLDFLERQARQNLAPIFQGETDTLIIGYRQSQREGMRYVLALSTAENGAIVLNLDASELLEFRKKIGFGSLLKEIGNNPGIKYVVLQDSGGIIAASGNIQAMDRISDSEFLHAAAQDTLFHAREYEFSSQPIFEAVQSFYFDGFFVGIFRLGLSMEPLIQLKARLIRRMIIISAILLIIGFVIVTFIFVWQNYSLLEKQYQIVETYSANIIQNVSDAIVVIDAQQRVRVWNPAAEDIFQVSADKALNKRFSDVVSSTHCEKILNSQSQINQFECNVGNHNRYLLVSRAKFRDEQEQENLILVIRDLTEQQQMQAQIQRQERMSAMGELASGVAHEIRNPLNTINTIVQQLKKDFEPKNEAEEYHQLAGIVIKEVSRINKTVQEFLQFARPLPVHPEKFNLSDFFNSLKKQYSALMREKGIELELEFLWSGDVQWDRMQMQQVFINLLQNSIDAIKENGKIHIKVKKAESEELIISFTDTGPGIPEEILNKIFNIYFTTKAKGTGIGLSIVQKIIFEHDGVISAQNREDGGAEFLIRLPIIVKKIKKNFEK